MIAYGLVTTSIAYKDATVSIFIQTSSHTGMDFSVAYGCKRI